jgi:hypothetical protein
MPCCSGSCFLLMQNYRWSKYDSMHCKRMHHLNPIKQTCP